MNTNSYRRFALTVTFFFCSIPVAAPGLAAISDNETALPNIVVIMADDLGYGDVQPNQSDSKIATPAFNRLASEGVNLTDAHSGSAVCTPTRYGVLCGRYCWRTQLKRGVLGGYSKPLINSGRQTIGTVLQQAGYHTGCVGKWHLGLGWKWKQTEPDNINEFGVAGEQGMVDYSQPISDGPLQHGFDESYIIPASLDMSPYVFIKNDRVTELPDQLVPGSPFPAFYRKGESPASFHHIDCLDHLADQACEFVERRAATGKPFFLYFPMPAPHKPVMPSPKFQGTSGLGPYGDFVRQVDATVGRVLDTIDRAGITDQTLVIVTSDNGSFMYRYDDSEKPDHTDKESIQGYRAANHRANGTLRGTKADVWEAGHRVPFFVRWPGKVKVAEKSTTTICHTDLLATVADAARTEFDAASAEDSFSFLPSIYLNADTPATRRPLVINHSSGGTFAIRDGKWKLVLGTGSGGRQAPTGKAFDKPYQLYDLEADLGETQDRHGDYPEVVQRLVDSFERLAHGDQPKQ